MAMIFLQLKIYFKWHLTTKYYYKIAVTIYSLTIPFDIILIREGTTAAVTTWSHFIISPPSRFILIYWWFVRFSTRCADLCDYLLGWADMCGLLLGCADLCSFLLGCADFLGFSSRVGWFMRLFTSLCFYSTLFILNCVGLWDFYWIVPVMCGSVRFFDRLCLLLLFEPFFAMIVIKFCPTTM